MTKRIDSNAAWALVRAVRPGSTKGPGRVQVEAKGVTIDVDSAGRWSTSAPADDDARDLLDLYLPLRTPAELVVGQMGQSLDGRIATESGASHFVTGPEDIQRLHRLRALVDVVIVGATTVVADDPQLTVRHVDGENPVRVIIDPSGRVDAGAGVRSDGASRTLFVRRAGRGVVDPEVRGDEIHVPATDGGQLDLTALLRVLRAEGLARVLVEGGGVTVSRFLEASLLDRLHMTVAPLLIGSGRPSVILEPIQTLDEAIRPACRTFKLGRDVLFDLDLRAGA